MPTTLVRSSSNFGLNLHEYSFGIENCLFDFNRSDTVKSDVSSVAFVPIKIKKVISYKLL